MTIFAYLELINKVEPEFQSLFIKLTKNEFSLWDEKTYLMMNYLADNNTKFKDIIDAKKNLKITLFSEPCVWLLFMNDEDFLSYLDDLWNCIIELLKNNVEEIQHLIEVISVLHNKNPERFKIEKK